MIRLYADDALVYAPLLDGYELLGLSATINVEKAGTAEIILPPGHPAYNAFTSYKTVITIYRSDELVFRGRALYPEDDFYGRRTITCEGERGFLQDGVMRAYSYKNLTAANLFRAAINRYNDQVEPFKQFALGRITIDATIALFESDQAAQVSDVIDSLVSECGGYIVFTTNSDGKRVINWLAELSNQSGQAIEFGENLLDYSSTGSNTDLATAIVPYGAKDANDKYITIESVNNGQDYIQDDAAVALRGFICKPVYFDDITSASRLLSRAKQYLAASKLIVTSLTLSAVDLSALDRDIDTFTPGDWVQVRSMPHATDDIFLLRERTYNFLDPAKDQLVFGRDVTTLTGADVAGDLSNSSQLQKTKQTLKTEVNQAIVNASSSTADTVLNEVNTIYSTKVNEPGQYMTHDGLLIQWGALDVTGSAALSYVYPYAEPPTVVVTPTAAAAAAHVSSCTATGATVATAATGKVKVHWIAIGKSA